MTLTRKIEPDKELVPANDPYPLPSTPMVLEVTPEMASSWLSYRNHPKNRPLSRGVSIRYQTDMEAGRWREATPEGLIFDTDGWGISFQHRMRALANVSTDVLIAKYGHPYLRFWIFPNEPREIFEVVDQAFKRTAAHLIQVPYATSIGAGARHLAALADGDPWGMPRFGRITTPEAVRAYHDWPELTWHTKDVHAMFMDSRIPIAPHLAVLAQASRTEHRHSIPAWISGIRSGEHLAGQDPRLVLPRRFRHNPPVGRNRRDVAYALIVKAWNAYVTGAPLTTVRHMSTETLPKVIGFEFNTEAKAA